MSEMMVSIASFIAAFLGGCFGSVVLILIMTVVGFLWGRKAPPAPPPYMARRGREEG